MCKTKDQLEREQQRVDDIEIYNGVNYQELSQPW